MNDIRESAQLIDIGCGTGKSAIGLAESGFNVTGLDYSDEILKVARGEPGGENVSFVLADWRDLPEFAP